MVCVVHGRDEILPHDSFSPWKSWSPGGDVCFHDRIAEEIKKKTLSADHIYSIAFHLLTKANEIALALLKEVRFADSTFIGEINTCALVIAQRHVAKACDLLLGKSSNGLSPNATSGDRLLHVYSDVTYECHRAVLLMNTFYRKLDAWVYEYDEKCEYVVRMDMLLVNALDVLQQFHFHACPSEYVTHDDESLDKVLGRAEHSLKIVTNALNAVKIPAENRTGQGMTIKRSALSSNCALLISTFKLLSLRTRRAFSVGQVRDFRVHENVQAVNYSCGFRSLILTTIADELVTTMEKCEDYSQLLTCSMVIWFLSLLSGDIDAISTGVYEDVEYGAGCETGIFSNIAECITLLKLLLLAHETKGTKDSEIGKMLERCRERVCHAALECESLEFQKEHRLTTEGKRRLYYVLASAEVTREDLAAISKNELPYTKWSSSLLDQAIGALDRALEACVSKLEIAEYSREGARNRSAACKALSPLGKFRKEAERRSRNLSGNGTTSQSIATSCTGDVVSASVSGSGNSLGGGYSGYEEPSSDSIVIPDSSLEYLSVGLTERDVMDIEQGIIGRTRL